MHGTVNIKFKDSNNLSLTTAMNSKNNIGIKVLVMINFNHFSYYSFLPFLVLFFIFISFRTLSLVL